MVGQRGRPAASRRGSVSRKKQKANHSLESWEEIRYWRIVDPATIYKACLGYVPEASAAKVHTLHHHFTPRKHTVPHARLTRLTLHTHPARPRALCRAPLPRRGPAAALGRFAHPLGQLLARIVLQILLLVEVGRDLDEPFRLDLDDLAHELLGGEDELVVHDPSRLRAVQLERLLELGRVVKVAGADGFGHGIGRVRVGGHLELDPLAQVLDLFPDVAGLAHGSHLDEVLEAPLGRVVGLRPLIPHVQKREVVAARTVEVGAGVVGVHRPLLWPVEDGGPDLEHGADGEHLGRASEPLGRDEHLG
eukprot:scaffold4687_cov117-Isochrysis_galbana.AAC.11